MSLFSNSTSRLLFRRSANARLVVPRHAGRSAVRYESTATGAAKETAKSAAETVKGAQSTAQSAAKSTTEQAAAKAQELQKQAAAGIAMAQQYSKQAAAGLAKAGASAQAMTKRLSQSGGRTGQLMGAVDKQIPLVIYWAKVAIEMGKIVFQAQKMSMPPMATFQAYFDATLARLKNPAELAKIFQQTVQSVRTVSTPQLVAGSVVALECLGFFTVGEMIGRFKIIGYRGKLPQEGHH